MPDQPPPRHAGDERRTLTELLQYQRDSFVKKVTGVDAEGAAASPVGSGTSLLWLANHLADAETIWVLRRFSQRPAADVETPHEATLDGAIERYRRVWAEVDAIVAASSLDDVCPPFDQRGDVDMRWILAHLIEETARHAGHADILRELLDGEVGR